MSQSRPRIPSSTYRLQFHADFTFRDAIAILDYLQGLGITDIYASPFFQAGTGSTHGYDVADHNQINPAVGDDSDFRKFVSELQRRDMGLIMDFVPNHMGISESLNSWWMDVLEEGTASNFAKYFDIDWYLTKKAFAEKVILPILGDRYGVVLESGALRLNYEEGAIFLMCYESRLPISPQSVPSILERALPTLSPDGQLRLNACIGMFSSAGKSQAKLELARLTESDPELEKAIREALTTIDGVEGDPSSFNALHELLEMQAYRLCYWRTAAEEINYRRFFDINTLAAIRIELPEVFEAAHQLIFQLLKNGDVTGLRIDHVDGLWDPREYLTRLQGRYAGLHGLETTPPPLYLLVEKIVESRDETLPLNWPTHGTTGYEFSNHLVHLFTNSATEGRFTKLYHRITGNSERFQDVVYEKKLLVMETAFASEFTALGRELDLISENHRYYRDFTRNQLTRALREVTACFPVYRTYVTAECPPSVEDERVILRAVSAARRRNPSIDKPVFDFIRNLLFMRLPEDISEAQRDQHVRFVMRFQQCTGPVMAKGLEDTALYLYHRFVALNEVGGNPGEFGMKTTEFHRLNSERALHFPQAMLTTSTHDTKRSEDVRMRMAAISEIPDDWKKGVTKWMRMNRKFRTRVDEDFAPSPNEEYLLYQTLVGAWPIETMTPELRSSLIERIQAYMLKALKEGKVNSSWVEPNEDWENAVCKFIESILDENSGASFQQEFLPLVEKVSVPGMWNSLSETILKCTSPGVPDIYQGTDLWDLSLVDPDNRRPVNYDIRSEALASLNNSSPEELIADWKSGRIKLDVIRRLLRFRREEAAFFRQADYLGLEVSGRHADHCVAFLRSNPGKQLLVIISRLTASMGDNLTGRAWEDTIIHLPDLQGGCQWHDILTGTVLENDHGNQLPVGSMLKHYPFAVAFLPARTDSS